MNGERREDDVATSAEERLLRLLASLEREDGAGAGLTGRVMRSVRWQHAVRGVFGAIGAVAGAVAEGLVVFVGIRRGRGGETQRYGR